MQHPKGKDFYCKRESRDSCNLNETNEYAILQGESLNLRSNRHKYQQESVLLLLLLLLLLLSLLLLLLLLLLLFL